MPNPLYIRRPPSVSGVRPGQVPDKQAPQKTPTFGYLVAKPLIKKEPAKKTAIANKPGFLERGGFRTHDQLVHEIRKDSYYKNIPTYGKKFSRTERMTLIKELEKAGRGSYGLTGEKLNEAIKNLIKQKSIAQSHWKFGKAKELDQKIKQAQVWKKAWDRPKI